MISFGSLDSMDKTSTMLGLISQKQKALSSNIANIDTPGYVRQDVNFAQYLSSGNDLETKLAQRLGSSPVFNDASGGPINPANELTEMQRNSILYTMAARRMSNIITQMKTVINVGK